MILVNMYHINEIGHWMRYSREGVQFDDDTIPPNKYIYTGMDPTQNRCNMNNQYNQNGYH